MNGVTTVHVRARWIGAAIVSTSLLALALTACGSGTTDAESAFLEEVRPLFEAVTQERSEPMPSDQQILEAAYKFCDGIRERVERGEELSEILTPTGDEVQYSWVIPLWELALEHLCPDVAATTSSEPAATATSTSAEPVVPSGWVTHTDEIAGFSLSYPGNWDVILLDGTAVAELIVGLEEILEVASVARPFQAGVEQSTGGFSPVVSVAVAALPDEVTAEEFLLAEQQALALMPSYEATEKVKAVVGGRESVLVFGSYLLSDLDPSLAGTFWFVQLSVAESRAGWSVACGWVEPDEAGPAPNRDECETVVRTFEILSD